MCDPHVGTTFTLYDRVVTVRLGTGVPIGTRGTVVGIMQARLNLDTYYEILFDNLSPTSLEAILHSRNQEKCRIKVHSYHLLNYSHSLRMRSSDYHSQRSNPSEQPPRFAAKQPNKNNNNTAKTPKSAPPLITDERPFFAQNNNQGWQNSSAQNSGRLLTFASLGKLIFSLLFSNTERNALFSSISTRTPTATFDIYTTAISSSHFLSTDDAATPSMESSIAWLCH